MCCYSVDPQPVCILTAEGNQFSAWKHFNYAANDEGVPVLSGHYYTIDVAGAVDAPYEPAAGDVITPGACAVIAPDVEWSEVCYKLENGDVVSIHCQTISVFTQTADGLVTTTTETLLENKDDTEAWTVPEGAEETDCSSCGSTTVIGAVGDYTALRSTKGKTLEG